MDKNPQAEKIYGVLGYPAKHSLSPLMHNAAFAALKINAEYKIFEKKPEELESFIRSLDKVGISGLNVTVPYKEKVIPFLNKISEEAKIIGAVNTIKVSGDYLEGFNTDAVGFLRHISEDLGFIPQGKTISLIGAGGAAKAISVALAKAGAKIISVCDIDKTKLDTLTASLKERFNKTEVRPACDIAGLNIGEADLLINATPIGMKETDACLVAGDLLHKGLLVYDLIYNPKETRLLRVAKESGCRISNGLGMLLYQGMVSFELWTGVSAPKEAMLKALS